MRCPTDHIEGPRERDRICIATHVRSAVLLVLGACGPGQEAADPTGPTTPASEPSATAKVLAAYRMTEPEHETESVVAVVVVRLS